MTFLDPDPRYVPEPPVIPNPRAKSCLWLLVALTVVVALLWTQPWK